MGAATAWPSLASTLILSAGVHEVTCYIVGRQLQRTATVAAGAWLHRLRMKVIEAMLAGAPMRLLVPPAFAISRATMVELPPETAAGNYGQC
jgi:hypothetical protein